MKRLILIATILAVLAMLGAFPVAFATHSRPFNGSASGSVTATSQTTVTITGTGHLEHLGKTMFAGTGTLTGRSECGGFTATEQDTLTANGDEVFISASDVICPTSNPNELPFHAQLTASLTITGGTGHFAHASGSGTAQVSIVMTSTAETFSATFAGTITY